MWLHTPTHFSRRVAAMFHTYIRTGGLLPKDAEAEVKASTILPLRSERNTTGLTVTYSTL